MNTISPDSVPCTGAVRVRFAPAPTGMMHLGNVRAALVNYLFAKQHGGSFILRLEDTDANRLFDPEGRMIIADLRWLGLSYDEGPDRGGPYAPYSQSERTAIYTAYLEQLIAQQKVYRCFCSAEQLEKKRQMQIALKKAPRYDRTCRSLTAAEVAERSAAQQPFIWRFIVGAESITISDLARGSVTFDLTNFSDFPLTRQDGSFTFIFANCVDDISMKITHVFRGEDHLSNTAHQVMLYAAYAAPVPVFWHTPIIINHEGKKLSKRDFGFSLNDLRAAGFLPEAILNYLAILGSKTPHEEIMDLATIRAQIDIAEHASANAIRYDSDKLRWVNHHWIAKSGVERIAHQCRPFLEAVYPAAADLAQGELVRIIEPFYKEWTTLADCVGALYSYFQTPTVDLVALQQHNLSATRTYIDALYAAACQEHDTELLLAAIRNIIGTAPAEHKKDLWALVRIALTGSADGARISDLFGILPHQTMVARLQTLTQIARTAAPK